MPPPVTTLRLRRAACKDAKSEHQHRRQRRSHYCFFHVQKIHLFLTSYYFASRMVAIFPHLLDSSNPAKGGLRPIFRTVADQRPPSRNLPVGEETGIDSSLTL
jgi:hypothetical protein